MALASLKCWGLLLQLHCTFTSSLSWALFRRDPDPDTWCRLSAFLHGLFNPGPSKPVPLRSRKTLPPVATSRLQLQCRKLRKHFREDITSLGCSLLNHSWLFSPSSPALIILAQQRFHCNGAGFLLTTANAFFSSGWPKLKVSNCPTRALKERSTFPLKLHAHPTPSSVLLSASLPKCP